MRAMADNTRGGEGDRASSGGQYSRRGRMTAEKGPAAMEGVHQSREAGVREWMERGDMWAQHVSVMLVVHVGRLAGIREDLGLVETSRQV